MENPSEETKEQWHNNPDNWKFGMFYFNKEDKRLLPPKRVKSMGWTVNFANPLSILFMASFIVAVILLGNWLHKTK